MCKTCWDEGGEEMRQVRNTRQRGLNCRHAVLWLHHIDSARHVHPRVVFDVCTVHTHAHVHVHAQVVRHHNHNHADCPDDYPESQISFLPNQDVLAIAHWRGGEMGCHVMRCDVM